MHFTPARRLSLSGLFDAMCTSGVTSPATRVKRPTTPSLLAKRRRGLSSPAPMLKPRAPARIALQNEDSSNDAIVITTLASRPFCCHEDLLSMSRSQLLTVASSFNAKLPAALRIDVSADHTDTTIRTAIEVLVGLRARPAGKENGFSGPRLEPAAVIKPRNIKTRHARTRSLDPGVIAAASRSVGLPRTPPARTRQPRRQSGKIHGATAGMGIGMYNASAHPEDAARLEILEEESENADDCLSMSMNADSGHDHDEHWQARPQKKRRLRMPASEIGLNDFGLNDDGDDERAAIDGDVQTTPTPAPRVRPLLRRTHRRSISQPVFASTSTLSDLGCDARPSNHNLKPMLTSRSGTVPNKMVREAASDAHVNHSRRSRRGLGQTSTPTRRAFKSAAASRPKPPSSSSSAVSVLGSAKPRHVREPAVWYPSAPALAAAEIQSGTSLDTVYHEALSSLPRNSLSTWTVDADGSSDESRLTFGIEGMSVSVRSLASDMTVAMNAEVESMVQ